MNLVGALDAALADVATARQAAEDARDQATAAQDALSTATAAFVLMTTGEKEPMVAFFEGESTANLPRPALFAELER